LKSALKFGSLGALLREGEVAVKLRRRKPAYTVIIHVFKISETAELSHWFGHSRQKYVISETNTSQRRTDVKDKVIPVLN
jgi:hypothetical protein